MTTAKDLVVHRIDFHLYKLIGDMFLNGLKLIVVPIVTTSIILAVANIGDRGGFGRLGGKTLLYYLTTSLLAIVLGLLLVNLFAPGVDATGHGVLVGRDVSAFAAEQAQIQQKITGKAGSDFFDIFLQMIPDNIFKAASDASLLGLIVVSMLVGFFMTRLPADHRGTLQRFVEAAYDITLRITNLVLRLAPIGVMFLIAATIAEQYAKLAPEARFDDFAWSIGAFALVVLLALAIHFGLTMSAILLLVAKVNPLRHYKAMMPALTTAFSTASSSATLPLTMECVEQRAGVSNRTASFVLPLGATVNMDGTALYECVAAMFICQAFGVELSVAQQFFIVVVALLTSIGVAGVPSASLVAIAVILQAVQGQLAEQGVTVALLGGMALLFVFDRPLDMCRTAVNIFSDSVGAVTIARSEGEAGVLGT